MQLSNPESKIDDEFLTIADVMHLLKVSRATVYRLRYAGTLPAYKIGNGTLVRFKRKEVERCVRSA